MECKGGKEKILNWFQSTGAVKSNSTQIMRRGDLSSAQIFRPDPAFGHSSFKDDSTDYYCRFIQINLPE